MNEVAILGGGCFWCLDAMYRQVNGVEQVVSGYAGGGMSKASYHDGSNHAEVIKVVFDPSVISYETILDIFWSMHDPTTLNRQGNDVGTEYRSIILTTTDKQLEIAESSRDKAQNELWDEPITTEIKPLDTFTEAEEHHQNFYNNNPEAGYCQVIINPKLDKFTKKFKHLLSSE